MPTHRMKLFSLLMGNSTPPEVVSVTPQEVNMAASAATPPPAHQYDSSIVPELNTEEEPVTTPPSPHYSINLDRLRRIFQALSSLNQDKATEADVGEEPLEMRRTYLGIFERLRRFGHKTNGDSDGVKQKTMQSRKERLMAFINRRNASVEDHDDSKTKSNWARNNFNRLTSSMRQVKSDSFLAKRKRKRRRKRESDENEQIRLPSMKTKKRSTVTHSRKLINTASQTAHSDLIKHLQLANSSQHCLDDIDFWNFEYPFENWVFEGGGAKVHTYIGAIKCLEEAGIKPKRLAGTSAGAITAGLLAVGYTSEEIHILYEYDVEYNVKDGTCGLLSLLPNMFRHYGWNPGERATRWFGECLAVKTGNPDITFQEVLDIYGVELCIVAVNLSNRCEEYFHPKTTPDMPIKLATRMSSSLPGYFQPVKQGTNVYIDGGLLCNYPVHVFDGWWLSMDRDDIFYKKMGSLENLPSLMDRKNRFGVYNKKTLGFCMYSMFDDKALRFELEKRHKLYVTQRPETKLSMKRLKQMKERDQRVETRDAKLDALSRFFKVLRKCHIVSGDEGLKKTDLIAEFRRQLEHWEETEVTDKQGFTTTHADIVFGAHTDLIALLDDIHADSSDRVSSSDLIAFLNRHNVDIHAIVGQQYLSRPEVSNFGSFFMTIQESLMNSARRVYVQTEDLDRTVGINTDYIKMDDFSLEREDQEFLIQQGYKATAAFLRYYIQQNYRVTKSQPVSRESSDLSAEDSDYSPVQVHSCDSNLDISDEDDNEMTSSLSSRTSRSTKSPSKSIGSPDNQMTAFDVPAAPCHLSSANDEDIIVAVVEHTPCAADVADDLQTMQTLTVSGQEPCQLSSSLTLANDTTS